MGVSGVSRALLGVPLGGLSRPSAMKVMYDDYAIVFNMGMFDETPPQKCVESICTLSAFTKELQERTFAFWWQLAILLYTLLGHARLHAKERH